MGFKEVLDLDCETAIALGGFNKKARKDNPTSIEGYFIGSKIVDSPKSKDGKAKLHIFQTAEGNVGVWGKTDLDRKMASVQPGAMTRAVFAGMAPSKNGDMYKYKVAQDTDNRIDVDTAPRNVPVESTESDEDYIAQAELNDLEADDAELEAAPVTRPVAPKVPLKTPSPASSFASFA
jgi:hypothetical protein